MPQTILMRLLPASAAAFLSACSMLPNMERFSVPGVNRLIGEEGMFRDRQGDYLEAEVIPRIQVPDGLDDYVIDDLLVVPEIAGNASQAFLDAPRPRPFGGGRAERGVVIQRMGDRNWVVVDASPSEVWPRVRDYWSSQGIQLAFENPARGILDTGWFTVEGNAETREKIRAVIEPGFQDNSAEIRLVHLAHEQAAPMAEQVNWPEASSDPELEYELLRGLSTYLADVAGLYEASSVSFLAENIETQGKASILRTPAGRELLRLDADFERSWAAVGRALERAGVEILTSSRELGIYEVEYLEGGAAAEEESPGLFKRVITLNGAFSRRRQEPQTYALQVQVLDIETGVEVLVGAMSSPAQMAQRSREPQELAEAEAALLRLIRAYLA